MHSRPLISFFVLCLSALVGRSQSISSFTPAYGQPNHDIITIYGSGFTYVTNVTFWPNKPATSWQVTADTQINAYIPVGATNGPITVNGPGSSTSVNDLIVIGPGPYITDLSATNGAVGTQIQINGVHFTGATSLKFNGTSAAGTITTDQQISATIPSGGTSGPITVTGPNGTGTSPVSFYFPPGVTNFSPTAGRAGTNVVIKGTNFLDTTKVLFGSIATTFTTNSLTQITAVVPTGVVTGPIRVVAPGGQYITTGNFVAQPDISSISPIAGNVNTVVTITGVNLNVGTPIVRFNGVVASGIIGTSATQIQVYAPSGTTSGPITVQTTDGVGTSPTNFYYPPSIISLIPTNGAPGTTVTINGQNLTNTSSVVFNTTSATTFNVVNNTTITATVPVGATTGQVTITNPGGSAASAQTFFITPTINSFSPQTGVVGIPVTIKGTNFSYFTHVLFNGVAATTASNTGDTNITANVPVGATTGPITVQTPGGNVTTSSNFTVVPLLLSITNVDPNTVAISWTTNAPGFFLQSTTNLEATNTGWSNEAALVQIIGGKVTVTNALTNTQKYYRLRN